MSEKSKILFMPMCSHGHINYLLPIASKFIESYSDKVEIHFALDEEFTEKVKKLIPKAHYTEYESPFKKHFTGNAIAEVMQKFGETWSEDLVRYVHSSAPMMQMQLNILIEMYPAMTKIIEDVKPSLINFDQLISPAFGKDKNIPWVNVVSAAMNFTGLEKMPPPQSGLPTDLTPENVKKWNLFIEQAYKNGPFAELVKNNSQHLKDKGLDGLDGQYFFFHQSPYLNIYGYPKELDYQEEGRNLPGNWFRIESPIVPPICPPFPVPDKLKNLPGKLIYFSFGSMANTFKPLFQKFLNILEQLPHRFIVSTGMMGDQYVMKDNMYGEKWLNQFAVLQTVDMVISHGGNNTLTESFFFGKPLIFLPLFGDQPDNAQRMMEKGLGKRLSAFDPDAKIKKDLEDAIEYCSQESVMNRMKKASERIQKDTGLNGACEEILKIMKN